jgi:EmrB/QacA subfamily drug resistance transporter
MTSRQAQVPALRARSRPAVILALVCGAQFIVILDLVVVNVALPRMQKALGLHPAELEWVVITYGLTFGGFLLLGGRCADLLGRRTMLVAGLTVFTAGSLSAGVAGSLTPLLVSRAVQGLGAAMAAPAALSILTATFAEGPARNKALGIFGGVAGSAACLGLIVGGVLVGGPGWRWIFLINLPIGVVLVGLVLMCIPKAGRAHRGSVDVLGAATVTTGLLAVVYAVNKSVDYGLTSLSTLGFLAAGAAVLGLFVIVEQRAAAPLIPLSMFRLKTLTAANIVAGLVMGSFFGMGFQITLFLQQVLGYSPLRTGAAGIATAAASVLVASLIAARVVGWIGAARTLMIGQGIAVAGLLYLSRMPAHADYWTDLFPAFLASGVAIGLSGVAIQVAAFIGVEEKVAGLAGGMISTAQEVGAALGLAVIATAALARSAEVTRRAGTQPVVHALAQTAGFRRGTLVAAGFSIAAALTGGLLLRRAEQPRALPVVAGAGSEPALRAA